MPDQPAHAAAIAGSAAAASQPSHAGAADRAGTYALMCQRLFTQDIMPTWWQQRPPAVMDAASLSLHQAAQAELCGALQSGASLMLLRAPRAGFGKTHLLARWSAQPETESRYLFGSLPWEAAESAPAPAPASGSALTLQRSVTGLLGRFPSAVALQKSCCGVLATLLGRLILQGKVPCANRSQALAALAGDPLLLTAKSGSASALAQWFAAQFEALLKPMAQAAMTDTDTATEAAPAPGPTVENWLRRLWQAALFSPSPLVTNPTQAATRSAAVELLQQGVQSDASARQLLQLLSQWKPLVLVADHLDGLLSQPQACTDLATLALALSQLPRVHILLSVNDDWWQHILTKNLPSALRDRLEASSIALPPLTLQAAQDLLRSRLQSLTPEPGQSLPQAPCPCPRPDTERFLQALPLESFFTPAHAGSGSDEVHASASTHGISCRELLRWVNPQWKAWLRSQPAWPASASAQSAAAPAPTSSKTEDAPPPPPLPALAADPPEVEDAQALAKLAQHLEQEAKGRTVDLSRYEDDTDPPPPGVVPLPRPAWKGSFLVEEEERGKTRPSPVSETAPATDADTQSKAAAGAGLKSGPHPHPQRHPHPHADLLHTRFIQWKAHLMHKGEVPELEEGGFRDLLRLTGQHFPMIRHEETELPGLSGQSIPRWLLPGQEIVFGLPAFQQREQWRLLGSYIAGRQAEIAAACAQYSEPMIDLKWVIFIQQQTATSWQALKNDDTLPASLDAVLDILLLSPAEQVDLVALHSLLRELSHKNKIALAHAGSSLSAAASAPASGDHSSPPFTFSTQPGLPAAGGSQRPASHAAMTAALHDLVASKLAPLWRRITRPNAASLR